MRSSGRIGQAHGIRGEVTVEVRTDDPDARFAAGAVLATDPPDARSADRRVRPRAHRGRLLVQLRRASTTAPPPRRCATRCWSSTPTRRLAGLDDPDEFYDHQLVGLRALTVDGREVGDVADVLHLPAQDLLAVAAPGRPRGAGPVRRGDRARGRPRRGGRVVVDPPPGLLDLPTGTVGDGAPMRVDIVTIFPDYLAPLRRLAARQGRGARRCSTSGVHDLRAWTDDVHRTVDDTPYGGGPGMVMRPEPWGEPSTPSPPTSPGSPDCCPRSSCPTPSGGAVHPGHGGRSSPRRRG